MEKKDEQLLLKDIYGRLPYGIIASVRGSDEEFQHFHILGVKDSKVWVKNDILLVNGFDDVEVVKHYLRPMSSMTKEEREEFRTLILPEASCAYKDCLEWDAQIIGGGYLQISVEDFSKVVDWLNKYHFDYRCLIEKGLALKAPKDMYNF